MHHTTFSKLELSEPIQQALREKNYTHPSPIQIQAIPHLLKGRDLIGCAQTGTGKTAAFALPILHSFHANPKRLSAHCPRALILTPTRELASQIMDSFQAYGKYLPLKYTAVFGGIRQHPQVRALSKGVDILVATPGRLQDLEQQKYLKLNEVEVFVLDEVDRMLDMGFLPDVKRILAKLPAKRQSLLFSATMPAAIEELANQILNQPVKVEVASSAPTADQIKQNICYVDRNDKRKLLLHFLRERPEELILVFVRTKHNADRLVEQLEKDHINAVAIHSNKSQGARTRALESFRSGRVKVLVATDIVARGIDVKDVSLVINFDLPDEPEAYIHRIGRTARAGAEGVAISFCDASERGFLRRIEKCTGQPIALIKDHPFAKPENQLTRGQTKEETRSSFSRSKRSFKNGRSSSRPSNSHRSFRSTKSPNKKVRILPS